MKIGTLPANVIFLQLGAAGWMIQDEIPVLTVGRPRFRYS
jgi:hypothetical protein